MYLFSNSTSASNCLIHNVLIFNMPYYAFNSVFLVKKNFQNIFLYSYLYSYS